MSAQPLGPVKAGITRLREKGGASSESLYNLVNGYVTAARSIKQRPGTPHVQALPPDGTKGLCTFRSKLHVFASAVVVVANPLFVVNILRHPVLETAVLADIHFAKPFLGYLYVVAEFDNGDVYHYWLQAVETWKPDAVYRIGQAVQPTVPNGFVYTAQRIGAPYPTWAPNVRRTVGDKVEPTKPNSFYYEVIDTIGADPRSGATEPTWPVADGATTFEDTGKPTPPPQTGGAGGPAELPPDVAERYLRDAISNRFNN